MVVLAFILELEFNKTLPFRNFLVDEPSLSAIIRTIDQTYRKISLFYFILIFGIVLFECDVFLV